MKSLKLLALSLLLGFSIAHADPPAALADNTRYLAMGDSLTAGYGAMPATEGYAYLLYKQGVYDSIPNTLFANVAIPGATSQHVLDFQVPLATQAGFHPDVITMTVGGNDLFTILGGADPTTVILGFQANLVAILSTLCVALPDTRIYVGNLYVIQNFPVPVETAVQYFNQTVAGVAAFANATACGGRVKVADVYSAFLGSQEGLLLINRHGAGPAEAHPTNAGYRAMAKAFIAAR